MGLENGLLRALICGVIVDDERLFARDFYSASSNAESRLSHRIGTIPVLNDSNLRLPSNRIANYLWSSKSSAN